MAAAGAVVAFSVIYANTKGEMRWFENVVGLEYSAEVGPYYHPLRRG